MVDEVCKVSLCFVVSLAGRVDVLVWIYIYYTLARCFWGVGGALSYKNKQYRHDKNFFLPGNDSMRSTQPLRNPDNKRKKTICDMVCDNAVTEPHVVCVESFFFCVNIGSFSHPILYCTSPLCSLITLSL